MKRKPRQVAQITDVALHDREGTYALPRNDDGVSHAELRVWEGIMLERYLMFKGFSWNKCC